MSQIDLREQTVFVEGKVLSKAEAELLNTQMELQRTKHEAEVALRQERESKGRKSKTVETFDQAIVEVTAQPQSIKKGDPRAGPSKGYAFTGKDDPRNGKGGTPFNQQMRKMNATLRDMLIDEGMKSAGNLGGDSKTRLQRVVERVFDEAELGEPWACQLVFERIDGKVPAVINADSTDTVVMVIRGASTDEL
jgi:hypothetical protein